MNVTGLVGRGAGGKVKEAGPGSWRECPKTERLLYAKKVISRVIVITCRNESQE